MAITFPSLAEAKATVLGYFRAQLGDWGLGPRDFFGKLAAVQTLVHYQFLRTARAIDLDAVPTSSTSTAGLDEWAENGTGVSNGAGGYGRKGAIAATGGVGTFTGTPGTVYPALSTLTASDGVTKFQLTNGPITVGGGGNVSGSISATTKGVAGNQPTNAVLTVDVVPSGGSASVTLATGLSGGSEGESNAALLSRVQGRIRNPPKAITASDLRDTAEGVSGCARAYVYPRRNGTGTADVVPTLTPSTDGSNSGGRDPGAPATATTVAGQVDAAIQAARNVAMEGLRTVRPTFGSGLAIVVRPTPASAAYAFDWTEPGALTVAAYSGTSLTLSGAAADLGAKVAAGLKPRLNIKNSSQVLPQQVRVTNYNAGTFVCTLEASLSPAPTIGDSVYAGGPMVDTIAANVLSLVNALGPSRVSGYLPDSSVDSWDDTLRIDQLRRVVLDAVDGDTRMAIALTATPSINGGTSDVQASDTLVTGPQLLFASSISVRQ